MKAKKIAFKTKDGREVSFKKKANGPQEKKTIKLLEKRLSAMEKAVSHYNASVREHQEKRKNEKKDKKERKTIDLTSLMKARSVPKKKVVEADSDSA
jgi:hypothetical protein